MSTKFASSDLVSQTDVAKKQFDVLSNDSTVLRFAKSEKKTVLNSQVTDLSIELESHATLLLVSVLDAPVVRYRATLQEGAHLHMINVTTSGETVEHDVVSTLEGRDARSDIDWIVLGNASQKRSVSARNVFSAPNGSGEIIIKGIAQDTATVKVDGMIDIGKNGSGTDTYLTEEVLMLDSTAKVDAVPGLEIKTNDVKASHSATVHRITPEDLFYFSARGIEKKEAREMYIAGFIGEILEKIPEGIRQEIPETL